MDCAVIKVPSDNAGADAISHDQVKCEIFDEELRIMLKRLTIKRVQDGMASTVSSRTSTLYRRTIAKILHMAAEWALINLALFGARERHAIMRKINDRGGRLT